MFALLHKTCTLETKYCLLGHVSMGQYAEYTTYGSYAICATLQDKHGKLIADSDWPALADKLPESNSAPTDFNKDQQYSIQYYRCFQQGHKSNNLQCLLFNQRRSTTNESSSNRGQKPYKKPPSVCPKNRWIYIEPKDLTQPCEVLEGRKWYFCTKCKSRAIGKMGFYQLCHTNATNNPNWRPEGKLTPIVDPDLTPAPPLCPPTQSHSGALDDDLVFMGINCTLILADWLLRDERERILRTSLVPEWPSMAQISRVFATGTVHKITV